MKQAEKLDLILKFLYEKRFDGGDYDIPEILLGYGINVNFEEGFALGKRLESDGLVKVIETKVGMAACLTTHGVDYIENDSYTYRGHSVTTNNYNISVSGSTNTNIVQSSSNVSISQTGNDLDEIIKEIVAKLDSETIEAQKLNDILDCLNEIKESVKNDIKPKFAFRSLLTMTSDVSSIGSLVVALGQILGQH